MKRLGRPIHAHGKLPYHPAARSAMRFFRRWANIGLRGKGQVFQPGEIWPDTDGVHINAHGGGIYYEGGTYYWFGQFKTAGEEGNVANVGVSVYSSDDLFHWKNQGIALRVVEDDPHHDIAKGCIIERPKVIRNPKSGQYVMWFHLELKG